MPKQLSPVDYALRHLQRQPKTYQEVRLKLFERRYDEADIESALQKLGSMWLVDDTLFLDLYMQSEVIKKGKPVYLARKKLTQRGIDKNQFDAYMQKYEEEIETGMKEAIKLYITQKKEKMDILDMMQKLQRKWYNYDLVKAAIQEMSEEK